MFLCLCLQICVSVFVQDDAREQEDAGPEDKQPAKEPNEEENYEEEEEEPEEEANHRAEM